MNEVRRFYVILAAETALLLLVGLTASTQWFAASVDYHRNLGLVLPIPNLSIYPPWSWIGWASDAISTDPTLVLKTSLPLVLMLGLSIANVLRARAKWPLNVLVAPKKSRIVTRIMELENRMPGPDTQLQPSESTASSSPGASSYGADTPSENFTEQLSLTDIEEVEVNWPEDRSEESAASFHLQDEEDQRTYRADDPSYAVLQHLSAHKHEDVTTQAPAGFSRHIIDETPRVDDVMDSIPTIHPDAPDDDETDDEPTLRAEDPASILPESSELEGSRSQERTEKRTAKMPVMSDEFFPRRRDSGLHIGEEQPDWAYSIATTEAPIPEEPAQNGADSDTKEGDSTGEDSDSMGWTI